MQKLLPIFLLLSLALPAAAADVSIAPQAGAASASISIPVRVNIGGEKANVIEGRIAIPEGLVIDSVSTTGSALSLFTVAPEYILADKAVIFTGGAPGSLTGDTIYLFTIHAHAAVPGSYTIKPSEFFLYRANGTGTRVTIATTDTTIDIGGTSAASVVEKVPVTRTPLTVDVGSDASLFEGKYFVTFFGGDLGAGINHYEVQEGWGRPVRAERYYVLTDQGRGLSIRVIAVNNDGRVVVTTIPAASPWTEVIMWGALALLPVAALFVFFRKRP